MIAAADTPLSTKEGAEAHPLPLPSPYERAIEQAQEFLTVLFTPYGGPATIEIRTFWPNGKPGPRQWFPVTREGIASCADFAILWRDRVDVYMGVLPRVNGGGEAEHLRRAAWIWCDLDPGDAPLQEVIDFLKACVDQRGLPRPDVLVVSGGGLHCYWRIDSTFVGTDADRLRLRKVMIRLGLLINGRVLGPKDAKELSVPHACPKATDSARILRVPGTFNLKQADNPRLVRLVRTAHYAETTLGWWEANLPAVPLPPKFTPRPFPDRWQWNAEGPSLPPATRDKIAYGAAQGMKHYAMLDVAVSARKNGYGETEIRALVEQTGAVSGVPMGDYQQQQHLDGIVDWAVNNVQPDYS